MKKYMIAYIAMLIILFMSMNIKAATKGYEDIFVFDCSGKYIKIDVNSWAPLREGTLINIESSKHLDACLVGDVKRDPESGRIYAILSKENTVDSMGRRHFRLVVLDDATYKVINSLEIKQPLSEEPELYLLNNRDELILKYELVTKANKDKTEVVKNLTRTELKEHSYSKNQLRGMINEVTYRNRNIETQALVNKLSNDGSILVNKILEKQFSNLYRVGAHGKAYLDVTIAETIGNKMVFVVASDYNENKSTERGGVIVYDVSKHKVDSSFVTPYQVSSTDFVNGPTVHLTPNGKFVVIEQYEWKAPMSKMAGEVPIRIKTGNMRIYNAESGICIGEIVLGPKPIRYGGIVNFSEDGNILYYASENKLYVINIENSKIIGTLNLSEEFTPIKVL